MLKLETKYRLLALVIATAVVSPCAFPQQSSKPSKRQPTGAAKKRPVHAETPGDTADLIARAEAAIQKREFADAEVLLKKAVEKNPRDFQAWFDLGYVYNATNRRAEAIEAFKSSVAAKPDVFESNLNLGLTLASAGQREEAVAALRRATELKPTANPAEGHARAWLSLGRLLSEQDPESALAAFNKAAQLAPKDPEPHLSAGEAHEQQKQYAAAEAEYHRALELAPDSTEAIIGIANVASASGNYPQAEQMLRKYTASNPKNGGARILLGRVLAAQGKADEARQEIEAGLALEPADTNAQRELAAMDLKAKKYPAAEERLRRLVQQSPEDADLRRDYGTSLLGQAKYAEAQAEFLHAVKLKPNDGETHGQLALAASNNKDYNLALTALNARSKYLPDTPGTFFLRATVLDHLGDKKQATDNYKQFLAVANGKYPDQEWQARHRLIAIDPEQKKR